MTNQNPQYDQFLKKQKLLLESLQTIQADFLRRGVSYGWCESSLKNLLLLSDSEFGFICEHMTKEDGTPFIRSHGISNITWDDETRAFYNAKKETGLDFFNFKSLWGEVITSGKAVISNDPDNDIRKGGYPKEDGHPPLNSFLGLPVNDTTGKTVGVMGVANREGGYSQEMVDLLTPFTSAYGFFIEKARIDARRREMEEELMKRNQFIESILEKLPIGLAVNRISDGSVSFINKKFEDIYGWPAEKMPRVENFFDCVFPDPSIREEMKSKIINDMQSGDPESMRWEDLEITRQDGKKRRVSAANIPIFDQDMMISTVQDFTDRYEAVDSLRYSIKEKEILLHEIHHRVKNNMQVINSLLKLQSSNIENAQIKELFKISQNRVYAMAAVHETLHGADNMSSIELNTYLHKIINSIFQSYSVSHDKVSLESHIDEVSISLNQAYPLGLVINELISNAMKYAFPGDRKGKITVDLSESKNNFQLIIMDDGVGFQKGENWENQKTLGLKLVRNLVENQLDGKIDLDNQLGTKFIINFIPQSEIN